jgi:hypothetical protein
LPSLATASVFIPIGRDPKLVHHGPKLAVFFMAAIGTGIEVDAVKVTTAAYRTR